MAGVVVRRGDQQNLVLGAIDLATKIDELV
jgi:hypothetical protein